ncbi:MAG: carboxypeptidase-like regulatory domain-containing protein [Tannerellaceae bacterium]|nr:carboxypeptidase-like regulatory domain-containing protein [Tannerellaceae bacterium]
MAVTVAQQTRVTGTVLSSEDGEPVIGASVMVKGTSQGTITDIDGKFEMEVPSSSRTMVIFIPSYSSYTMDCISREV